MIARNSQATIRVAASPAAGAQDPEPSRAQTPLVRQARLPVRRFKLAWSAVSDQVSRLKHQVTYKVRAAVVEHIAAPVGETMDEETMSRHRTAKDDRFHTEVTYQVWNKGGQNWVTKTGMDLYRNKLQDPVLIACQYRYVEQLGRTGIHVDHSTPVTATATQHRPLRTLDEHIATIGQMVDRLGMHLELELADKKSSRSPDVIDKIRQSILALKQEKLHLQQRTRPLLKDWLSKGHQIDERAHLGHLIQLGQIPEATVQAWRDHDFSVLTALKAFDAGMELTDFAQLASVDVAQDLTDTQRQSIQYLVDAKDAMPAVSADDFKQLAPTLLKQQTPLGILGLMSKQKIVQNSQTLPATVPADTPIEKLGAGSVNTVYRVTLQDGTVMVFKGEGAEVADQARNAGVGQALNGANLSGRTLVSAAVAQQLGIRSAPAARPVVLDIPGAGPSYGTLSDFVPGASVTSGAGDSASVSLTADQYTALQGLTPDVLNGIAQGFGFKTAELESSNGYHQLKLTTGDAGQFTTPLDLNSPQVRESASNLGFWAAITGQVDLHSANVKQVPRDDGGIELVSFDNDMSAGKLHHHPNSGIADSEAHHQQWQQAIRQCVDQALSGSQELIELPQTIGKIQREAILAMTRERFLARYQGVGLDASQQNRAWARLQGIQYNIRRQNDDDTLSIPVAAIEWKAHGIGMTTSSGIPKVISASLKDRILALDEATVRQQMFGALGPEEQAAGWSRVMAIQDELSIPNHIQVIDTTEGWTAPAVTQAMGLDPAALEANVRTSAGQNDFDGKATLREASMNHGILAAWAVSQTLSRLCAEGSASPSGSGPAALAWKANADAAAYFDAAAILKTALAKAAEAQENA